MRREGIDAPEIGKLIGRSNATILDIGANKGDMSENFAHWFPYAQVFAFEPDPRAIRKILARGLNARVHLIPKALGRTVGKATFHQSSGQDIGTGRIDAETGQIEEWDQSGSLREPKEHLTAWPWIKFETTIEVDVTTLDDWRAENHIKCIDFIWADVQGAEEDLIRGGLDTLSNTRYFYTEFSDRELYKGALGLQGIIDILPSFEVVEVFERDVLLRNRDPWADF